MYRPEHQFFVALANAQRAARRNDIVLTERWIKVAERHLAISERFHKMEKAEQPDGHGRPARLRR